MDATSYGPDMTIAVELNVKHQYKQIQTRNQSDIHATF